MKALIENVFYGVQFWKLYCFEPGTLTALNLKGSVPAACAAASLTTT